MYWTNSTVVTTPMNPVNTAQESNQNQYPQLSATEIKKVLSFSGMSDTGKFEAIIAKTDTAGLLAMVGISYADLKGILALPNDKPTTAPGISPAFPSTENAGITSVHDASPTVSGTGTPAAGSPTLTPPPPAPPALAEMHDAGLPPKAIDSGADIDAVNTPSPATSDIVPHSNPAPLAPAPETNATQGMLPDGPCTVEFQPVVAEPVPVPENSDVQGVLPDGPCTAYVPISEAAPVPVPVEDPIQGMLPDTPCSVELPADELLAVHAGTDSSTPPQGYDALTRFPCNVVEVGAGTDRSTPQEGLYVGPMSAEPNPGPLPGADAEAGDPAQGYDALTRFPYSVVDVGGGTDSSTPSTLAELPVAPDEPGTIPATPSTQSDDDDELPIAAASGAGGIELTIKLAEPTAREFSNLIGVRQNALDASHGDIFDNPALNLPEQVSDVDEEISISRTDPVMEAMDQRVAEMERQSELSSNGVDLPVMRSVVVNDVDIRNSGHGVINVSGPGSNFQVRLGGFGGGGGGGASAVTKVLAGIGAGAVAGGIGLGIWAAADTDGFRDAFTRDSNSSAAPDPHDPPATLVATPYTSAVDSLAPVALDPELMPLPLTNVNAPAANLGAPAPAEMPPATTPPSPLAVTPSDYPPPTQPFAGPDRGASSAIADTPVTLMVALSEHGGISFADVAGDISTIQAILAQWISNAAPDCPLALQGLDIADFGDGSGLSLMVYLNAYVDPSTGFNSALTADSINTLQFAVQHHVDGWLHGTAPDIGLIGTSTTPIAH